jgi:hypothetical protein
MLFDIPDVPIDMQMTWERDVSIIQIGQSFVPNMVQRRNVNRLLDISKNSADEIIAQIGGIIYESIDGNFELVVSDNTVPVSYEYTYFFYGLFNVTQGYWEQNTTLAYLNEQDSGKLKDVTIYMLKKTDQ